MQDAGHMNWGFMIMAVLYGIAIFRNDSRIAKLERRLDELSDLLSERFKIEI